MVFNPTGRRPQLAMPNPLEPEDRLLAAFLRGARHPKLKDTFLIGYRRDGADLHRLYKPGLVARRLRPARGRRAGIIWVHLSDRLLDWRLGQVAESRKLKLIVVKGRACPVDAEEGLRWLALERETFELKQRLHDEGHRTSTDLDAVIRFPRAEVTAAVLRHPELVARYPTRFRRYCAKRGGTAVAQESWVTPEGVELTRIATTLAKGQGIPWGEAFDLVVGAGR
jgi:hypothetical protein